MNYSQLQTVHLIHSWHGLHARPCWMYVLLTTLFFSLSGSSPNTLHHDQTVFADTCSVGPRLLVSLIAAAICASFFRSFFIDTIKALKLIALILLFFFTVSTRRACDFFLFSCAAAPVWGIVFPAALVRAHAPLSTRAPCEAKHCSCNNTPCFC